ncbi:peptidase [Croceicoccus ponticola]|uniref:Peptidase n=1 Tax=Croceicoccus ponticola TaxID=2217664 RepID=A0A437GWF5_9SPHN|nr:prepilin peptidase [Croceicoccus ponticola]RVQ66460.1 peptidase [Croceicoccus ponticola]
MNAGMVTYGLLAGLAIAVLYGAFTDIRSRKITNRLTLTVAAFAPAFWWASGLAIWPGVAVQLLLAAGMFAFGALMFRLRQMGGGDVKLLTAIALWLPPTTFGVLMLMICIANGVLTAAMIARHRRIKRSGLEAKQLQVPYGISVAVCMLMLLAGRYGPGLHATMTTNSMLS